MHTVAATWACCRSRTSAAFCLGEVHFGNPSSWLVTAVALNPGNTGQMAVFDLAYRPVTYLDMSVEQLVEVMNSKEKAIRVVAANNQPIIVDNRTAFRSIPDLEFARRLLRPRRSQGYGFRRLGRHR